MKVVRQEPVHSRRSITFSPSQSEFWPAYIRTDESYGRRGEREIAEKIDLPQRHRAHGGLENLGFSILLSSVLSVAWG